MKSTRNNAGKNSGMCTTEDLRCTVISCLFSAVGFIANRRSPRHATWHNPRLLNAVSRILSSLFPFSS